MNVYCIIESAVKAATVHWGFRYNRVEPLFTVIHPPHLPIHMFHSMFLLFLILKMWSEDLNIEK